MTDRNRPLITLDPCVEEFAYINRRLTEDEREAWFAEAAKRHDLTRTMDLQARQTTLTDAAREAVAAEDGPRICRIADTLRFKHGYGYEQTLTFFENVGADRADIEGYFYEADSPGEGSGI